MPFTYDVSTDRGKARLLMRDTVSARAIFQDDEVDTFLAFEGGNVRRAAAMGLETIASDQALTLKVTSLNGFSVNGVSVSAELLKRATSLRDQADAAEAMEGEGFDIAEQVVTPFNSAERYWSEALRQG